MPTLTVIAGPNGCGKSTFTRTAIFEGRERLLDPDAIARGLDPSDPSRAAFAAGREVLRCTTVYLHQRVSFAVETTLSSRNRANLVRQAKSRGYKVNLLFLNLESPERCIHRVAERVARGGHSVPAADVRRRYRRSVLIAIEVLALIDRAAFCDNSGDRARLVLSVEAGRITWRAEPLPAWLKL